MTILFSYSKSCIKSANVRLAKLSIPEFTFVNEDIRSKYNAAVAFLYNFLTDV